MAFVHPIVELRQYTLLPGQREALIELFDREFVTGQEAEGMAIIGQFRDLDRDDRFVWMRGFPNMASRLASLTAFYSGKHWKAHRAEANATMLDVSDVLLLHPIGNKEPLATMPDPVAPDVLVATIVSLNDAGTEQFPSEFARPIAPILTEHGAEIVATYETDTSPNDFPGLAVRESVRMFVWLSWFADADAHQKHRTAIASSDDWRRTAQPLFDRMTVGSPVTLRPEATPGSRYQPWLTV